jgi:hypothetical protein
MIILKMEAVNSKLRHESRHKTVAALNEAQDRVCEQWQRLDPNVRIQVRLVTEDVHEEEWS